MNKYIGLAMTVRNPLKFWGEKRRYGMWVTISGLDKKTLDVVEMLFCVMPKWFKIFDLQIKRLTTEPQIGRDLYL